MRLDKLGYRVQQRYDAILGTARDRCKGIGRHFGVQSTAADGATYSNKARAYGVEIVHPVNIAEIYALGAGEFSTLKPNYGVFMYTPGGEGTPAILLYLIWVS